MRLFLPLTNVKWHSDLRQWLPNLSDFSPISWPWYRGWPLPNYVWFPASICNGCGIPTGTLTLPDIWVRSFFGTCLFSNCRDLFYELAISSLDCHLKYPSVLSRFCLFDYGECFFWVKLMTFRRQKESPIEVFRPTETTQVLKPVLISMQCRQTITEGRL